MPTYSTIPKDNDSMIHHDPSIFEKSSTSLSWQIKRMLSWEDPLCKPKKCSPLTCYTRFVLPPRKHGMPVRSQVKGKSSWPLHSTVHCEGEKDAGTVQQTRNCTREASTACKSLHLLFCCISTSIAKISGKVSTKGITCSLWQRMSSSVNQDEALKVCRSILSLRQIHSGWWDLTTSSMMCKDGRIHDRKHQETLGILGPSGTRIVVKQKKNSSTSLRKDCAMLDSLNSCLRRNWRTTFSRGPVSLCGE